MTTTTTKNKTKTYKFTGKASWAKVYEPDTFRGSTNWKIDVTLDEESAKLYEESGIQSKLKQKDDGPTASFKRPQTKLVSGVQQIFAGPKIVDKDGKTIVEYKKNADGTGFDRVGDPVLIGNGSLVEVTVSVYPTSMGPGQRMESIRVIDLIEYSSSGDGGFSDRIVVGEAVKGAEGVKAPW